MVDVARALYEKQNIKVKYINLPWRRALEFSLQGVVDGALAVTRQQTHGTVIGEQMLGYDETVIITRRLEPLDYQGTDSLKGKRIGVITHYTYDNGGEIDQFLAEHSDNVEVLYHEAALESLLLMLLSRRIDVILENRYVAQHKVKALDIAEQISLSSTGVYTPVYIGFTPGPEGERHARMMDEGIKALRAGGELQRILMRYGMEDWEVTSEKLQGLDNSGQSVAQSSGDNDSTGAPKI
ncbi:ABC transporter substrate-binding protein [Simiduia agarivorans SA1 = DSM 21679]|uniref:ABC transporter substrate-binding protein n=2 Tax=Simiduia TaxID=447467 RepID=K4KQ30_SIMAS|nr:ABC transporter substrate-binding protein [Simiduia agarivorans SA1 = DSM 21679]